MEDQLPHIPHAEQVQVAQDNHAQESEGLQFLKGRVEQIEVALWTQGVHSPSYCHKDCD